MPYSDHDDNRRERSRWVDILLSEVVVKMLIYVGSLAVVSAMIIGGVAIAYDVSFSTALTGIISVSLLIALVVGFFASMD